MKEPAKVIKDKECMKCTKFFECQGKPETTKDCINFVERTDIRDLKKGWIKALNELL